MGLLAVYGHCTVDRITISGDTYEQIGGSACYCAIMARRLGFDAHMLTRFGPDFPRAYLDDERVTYADSALSSSMTTRFALSVAGGGGAERTLKLEHACTPIDYEPSGDADCTVVSPLCGEISGETLAMVKKDSAFLLVDPQGFLRVSGGGDGTVTLRRADLDLSGVGAVKASRDEAYHLTGASGDEAMILLQKRGVSNVLYTDGVNISLLNGDKIYSIVLPNKRIYDTTGVGDILCSAFCCTMIKERDFLWALCFAGGAAQAALDSKRVGLQKIPRKGQVQVNASYFYNMVKFRTL